MVSENGILFARLSFEVVSETERQLCSIVLNLITFLVLSSPIVLRMPSFVFAIATSVELG